MAQDSASVSLPDTDDVRRYARLGRKRILVGWKRLELKTARSPRLLDADRAIERLSDSPRILFLCLGNICRSPMAERYLRAGLHERGLDQFTVESAGFIENEDRPSPDYAVTAAAEHGVDLSEHRSKLVTEEMLDESDLVFLMDAYNRVLLERHFEESTDKAVLLQAFGNGDAHEIDDPYGTEPAEYRVAYEEVSQALDSFLEHVEEAYQ